MIHQENLEVTSESIERHHFHLKHKSTVTVSVNDTNGAGLATEVYSDGFLVDMTKPISTFLADGYNVTKDEQYVVSAVQHNEKSCVFLEKVI